MPEEKKKVYWDANVWLSYINGIADRLSTLDALMADSASPQGKLQLITSTISKVEVAFAEQERTNQALDSQIEAEIDRLLGDRALVLVIELHDSVALVARQLMRQAITSGWKLRPMDAIHIATAKLNGAVEVHSYDEKLLAHSNHFGLPIVRPYTISPRMI